MNHEGFWSGWWEWAPSQPRVSTGQCFLILLVIDSCLRQTCELTSTQPNIWGKSSVVCLFHSSILSLSPPCKFLWPLPQTPCSFTWGCWLCSTYFSLKLVSCGCCRAHFVCFLPTKDHCPSLFDFQSCLENHHFLKFIHLVPFKGKGIFSPWDWFHIDQKWRSGTCVLREVWM